ncbi:hypothetical protein F511_12374 [Dorcoceras hygrometricum]|uniref:Uncharacterized protein n=1 Tax=Dorcoceras hygrometricum TaxID=472368 RepID=A0A2Z7DF38_9LAMI|nr:hypothetical protein F511_12374 [Dorcoceras hygrometricum]
MSSITFTPLVSAAAHQEKPFKFSGADFKRWQQKMLFYLTTVSLSWFLTEEPPVVTEGDTDTQRTTAVDAWNHNDFLCRNYILNSLDDVLYGVYCSVKTAKELWNSLEKKYKTEDAGVKKFIVGKFLDYKMVDAKTVMSQVQEIQIIIHDLIAEGMEINEPFQVAAIIEKLPQMWRDFKNYLKHKRKELTLEELIVRLRIEEDSRTSDAKTYKKAMEAEAKANLTESSNAQKRKRPKERATTVANQIIWPRTVVFRRRTKVRIAPVRDNRPPSINIGIVGSRSTHSAFCSLLSNFLCTLYFPPHSQKVRKLILFAVITRCCAVLCNL